MSISSTRAEYAEWVAAYAAKHPYGRGLCGIACDEMRAAFPELTKVFGFAVLFEGSPGCEHVWLVDPLGHVVDPTAHQFKQMRADLFEGDVRSETAQAPITYRAFQPGDTVRVGRCRECGDAIFAEVESLDDPKYARSICDECKGGDQGFGRSPYEDLDP